jgi:hypothetical protein
MPINKFKLWVNRESEKKIEKFGSLPLMMRAGIILLVISFGFGYAGPVLIIIVSAFHGHLSQGLISGSALYIINWIIGAVGLAMAGRGCIKYPLLFFAKLIKVLFPSYFKGD